MSKKTDKPFFKRKPRKGEGSVVDAWSMQPDAIKADHRRNYSRVLPVYYDVPKELEQFYTTDDGSKPVFCFTLAQVEERLESFKLHGQIQPIGVYLTATNEAHLVYGYLRLAAWQLALVRGEIDQIPGAKRGGGKIRCDPVTQPKSPEDWAALADRNFEENEASLDLSPVQKAYYFRSLIDDPPQGRGLTIKAASAKVGLSENRFNRYKALLALPPDQLIAVHAGVTTMAAALRRGSKTGQGTARGPRPGVAQSRQKTALERMTKANTKGPDLTGDEAWIAFSLLSGHTRLEDWEAEGAAPLPENARRWYELLNKDDDDE